MLCSCFRSFQDTGTLYAVAKLRGTNFFNSQIARVQFDVESNKYSFASAGERSVIIPRENEGI